MRWLDSLSSTTQLREPPYLRLQAFNHVTNSGQKKLKRILFLPETFIHMIQSHLLNFASVVSFLCPCFSQILGDSLLVTINFCSNSSDSRKELIHTKSLYFFALARERESPLRPWPYFRFSDPVSLNLSSRNCSNNLSVCWATVASLVSWSLITEELTQETKRKLMKNNLSQFFGTPKSKLLRRHDGGKIFSSVQRQE